MVALDLGNVMSPWAINTSSRYPISERRHVACYTLRKAYFGETYP